MYRTVAASFWTDPKVKQLTAEGKLFLLYLITNPHTHVSGIYVLNLKYAATDIGFSKNTLSANLDTLSKAGFCVFDPKTSVIWVRKMMAYQGSGDKNLRSAAYHLMEDLHNSFLCIDFLDAYPDVRQFVKPSFIDTLSGKSDRVSRVGTPDPDPDPDPDSRFLNPEPDGRRPAKRATQPPPEFLPITAEMANFATSLGVCDIQRETEAMLDHFRGKGESRADWVATWRTWIRNSKRFGGTSERHKNKADRNRENAERLLSRFDSEDGGSGMR